MTSRKFATTLNVGKELCCVMSAVFIVNTVTPPENTTHARVGRKHKSPSIPIPIDFYAVQSSEHPEPPSAPSLPLQTIPFSVASTTMPSTAAVNLLIKS